MGPRGSVAFRALVEARTRVLVAPVRARARGLVVRASLGSQVHGAEAAVAAAAMEAATKVAEAVVKVAGMGAMGAVARVDEAARVAEVATQAAAKKVAHW